jgi:hypothetical protein
MQEADEAHLAKRLRVVRRKSTSRTTAAAIGFLVASLMVAALMLLGASGPAHASTTFTVNQTTDVVDENLADNLCDINSAVSGEQCTLRAAIQEANDTPGADTITLPAGKTGVKRTTNLSATFLVTMNGASLSSSTFKLLKANRDGSTTQVTAVAVSSSTDGLKATLNPDSRLAKNTKYSGAVVTTGAKDAAGNRLDQDRKQANNQQKGWFFTTGSS